MRSANMHRRSRRNGPIRRGWTRIICYGSTTLRWNYQLKSGGTLWNELVTRYDRGVAQIDAMAATWDSLDDFIDPERHADVAGALTNQQHEARWWRDASLAYWQSFNHLPLPAGHAAPAHPLDWSRAQTFPEAPGQ